MFSTSIATARTYSFIGFIFYVLAVIAGFLGVLVLAFFFVTAVSTSSSLPGSPVTVSVAFPFLGFLSVIFLLLFIPGILLSLFAWSTVRHIDAGRYDQARTNSLILGIVGLFFGLIIGGIFFLLSYAKLGESTTPSTLVQSLPQRFCVNCGRAVSPNDKFCKHCGKELPP